MLDCSRSSADADARRLLARATREGPVSSTPAGPCWTFTTVGYSA